MKSVDKLVPALKDSIFNSDIKAEALEYFELGIDTITESEMIKNIPIVNTLLALWKTGGTISERHFLLETLDFIKGFNDGTISTEKLQKYRDMINNNPQKAEKELGRVMFLCNSHMEEEQSLRLGYIYKSYVMEVITWEKFCELSEVNRRMFAADMQVLETIKNGERIDNYYQADRLSSLGLVSIKGTNWIDCDAHFQDNRNYTITFLGKEFLDNIH